MKRRPRRSTPAVLTALVLLAACALVAVVAIQMIIGEPPWVDYAVVGIVMVAAGGFAVATHFGMLTIVDPHSALVPGTEAPPTWVLYVIAAVAIIAGMLDSSRGRTELAASTATTPLVGELTTYTGVRAVHATLAGSHEAPALALVIHLEQNGDLTAIRDRIQTHGLPRLRQALDLDALPTTVEFRVTTKTGARVR